MSNVKQLAPLFSCSDTTSAKPYCLDNKMFVYGYKNRFLDIFPWPNYVSSVLYYIWLNTVIVMMLLTCQESG